MSARCALLACGLLAIAGCSAPASCNGSYATEQLESERVTGFFELSRAGESASQRVRIRLRNAPVLLPIHGAGFNGRMDLNLQLAYVDAVTASAIEMPRLRVSSPLSGTQETSAFPATSGFGFSLPLSFDCSPGDARSCCPSGGSDCPLDTTLTFERLDGEPFPAVRADWTLAASMSISDCPPGNTNAALELEALDP